MSVSIIVGGQYGSEGKGKVAYWWAKKMNAEAAVRVGGSNSGHTVYDCGGKKYPLRVLPSASLLDGVTSVLPAGSYIDTPVLIEEIKRIGLKSQTIKIDPNAVIIKKEYKTAEQEMGLQKRISSTLSGTGIALIKRVERYKNLIMAKDVPELHPFLSDTKEYLRKLLYNGKHVIIEGTQGYGLSNYHAQSYPYVTARDTTAAGFLAETGLSPLDVEHVVMVIRTFPIRVAGKSGPLENETTWEQVSMESGAPAYFEEKTTVTQRVRRVAYFTADIVKEAIRANNPDVIILNHMDYVDYAQKNAPYLSAKQTVFLSNVEKQIDRRISYCGNGEMNLIDLRQCF